MIRRIGGALLIWLLVWPFLSGCSRPEPVWTDDEVTFVADGLTLYGTYRHRSGAGPGPAALLISESGTTDRNGDNAVAGRIGNMRQLAEFLSDHGVATLRYDKVGTGATGLGPHAKSPADVGSAVYTAGAKAAVRFLAGQPGTAGDRISVYALGEGTVHAMSLAADSTPGAPKIHALGLLQPLPARYLDLISARVEADVAASVGRGETTRKQADQTLATWREAVRQIRRDGTVPKALPSGLNAIVNPDNVKAVVELDVIDPLGLAARVPDGMPVLLTCSDADGQARCDAVAPLARALAHTELDLVELKGVNHVLRDDPTDSIANYARKDPLSPQFTDALSAFLAKTQ